MLTVNGAGFTTASVVRWGGSNRTTVFVSTSQLLALIPADDLVVAATVAITVFDDPTTSNSLSFTVSVPATPVLNPEFFAF